MAQLTQLTLQPAEHIDVVVDGLIVRVISAMDADGNPYLHLRGVDCSLHGDQPGRFYLEPMDS